MANVIHTTARPYMPGDRAVGLLGGTVAAFRDTLTSLRDAYVAERREQRLAHATRDLDLHLLRDIGLDHGAS
ncbi:hypothetical protein HBA54_06075 [Pelagibius litoralis]|uniref:DUF1127 domain-containing protein n=1 Tax=Pelagibius litoralis TaxID=374515 RepID=A0A967C296_9PROT|nr:hypothetical protein [Pelagibius litoralis]NIA68153.1 hypothetical protein [Pelagibius litoralis]